ncbi:MAG: hypothetical protein CMH77_01535, partial [Nitrospinae bacterium]|nr:hypothetical protein [Nitrospinota bacterium]
DFMGTGLTDCISHKTLLTSFKEIFASLVGDLLTKFLGVTTSYVESIDETGEVICLACKSLL